MHAVRSIRDRQIGQRALGRPPRREPALAVPAAPPVQRGRKVDREIPAALTAERQPQAAGINRPRSATCLRLLSRYLGLVDQAVFPVIDVDSWAVLRFEAVGSDEKVWLVDPQTERRALFKPNERQENSQQGEDWPEKVASELAVMLGVPAARFDLATRRDRRGCISHDVAPDWELQHGTLLLEQYLGFHDPMDREHRGHTLANVRKVLEPYAPPPGFAGPTALMRSTCSLATSCSTP